MRVVLPHSCQRGCAPCEDVLTIGAGPIPAAALGEKFSHAKGTDQRSVYVFGTNLASHPALKAVTEVARLDSLQVCLVEEGPGTDLPLRVAELRRLGIRHLYLTPPNRPPPSSDSASASSEAMRQFLGMLLALSRNVHVVLGMHVALREGWKRELWAVGRVRARLPVAELLVSAPLDAARPPSRDAHAALTALQEAWRTAGALRMRLRFVGFRGSQPLHPLHADQPPVLDAALLEAIRHRIPLASCSAGVRALGEPGRASEWTELARDADGLRALGLELRARGAPCVDLPPCCGGAQADTSTASATSSDFLKSEACPTCPLDARCPGVSNRSDPVAPFPLQPALRPLPSWPAVERPPRVLILSSQGEDPIFYRSTLPALAHALRARGATVEIVSPWSSTWSASALQTSVTPDWLGTTGVERWLNTHEIADFDLVITADFATAQIALGAGAARAARVVVVDFHMLAGIGDAITSWQPTAMRPSEGGWWPSERLTLESAFPGYVRLYLNYGVPLTHVAWRPFALHPGHFPTGGDVHEGRVIFSGGNHLRDLETLRAATERLATDVGPVALYGYGERFAGNPHLQHEGSVALPEFYRALASSRFVVLPLIEDATRAAGVTVLAMALMAGRPVVATDTAATRDYVHDGVEGLLVPSGDPAALADAITRLDTDRALLTTLAAGARRAGQRISTERWAEQVISGTPLAPVREPSGWRHW